MSRILTARLILVLAVASSAACGDREAEAGVSTGADAAVAGSRDASGEPAPARGSADELEVSISDPPFDGTHQMSGNFECFTHDGLWGASGDNGRERGVSAILVIVKGIPERGGTSGDVALSLTFGQIPMDDIDLETGLIQIHGSENGGDARVTVTRDGPGAVYRIEGTAQHGARVSAVVRCRTVNVVE